jgi:DNA-binding response OmpR family regulator
LFQIDRDRMGVIWNGKLLRPNGTATFALLAYLSAHPGVIRSHQQIVDACGRGFNTDENTAASMVKRARAWMMQCGMPPMIMTLHGVGYYWRD